jgi:hypothetical protein
MMTLMANTMQMNSTIGIASAKLKLMSLSLAVRAQLPFAAMDTVGAAPVAPVVRNSLE